MEEDKFKDLLEDEELRVLRLAALATKRKNDQNVNNSSESADALPINSIITSATASEPVSNQIPFVQSDRSGHNSWRKQNQLSRRRGGAFPEKSQKKRRRDVIKIAVKTDISCHKNSVKLPRYKKVKSCGGIQDAINKSSQRSNLIVINPTAGKDADGKTSSLVLPQHKWCNSGNEDSMSPKTLRKTGPTRFNRHGSDSESSDDSDYENSDNDSGSNETILQDEPSEHFSRLSPGCDTSDKVEKKRRLSFQSLDPEVKSDTFDKNEATSVYNLLKNSSYTDKKSDNYAPLQNMNECDQPWNNSVESKCNNYKQYSTGHAYTSKTLDPSSDIANTWHDMRIKNGDSYYPENSRNRVLSDKNDNDKRQMFGETHAWQHGEGHGINNSYYSRDIACNVMDSKSDKTKLQCLSDDLQMELQKCVQDVKPHSTNSESNEMVESKNYGQNNTWDKNRQRSTYKGDKMDVSTNSFNNKNESTDLYTDRSKQKFSRENDVENTSNLNRRNYQDSLSRERNIQEGSSTRDKSRFEYSLDSERNRHDSSSNLGRSRNERSSSQDRSRYDRSSSLDKKKRDCSISPSRNKQEHSYRQVTSYSDRSNAEDRKRDQYRSNLNRNRSKRSSSQDRRRYDRSSSSDSKSRRSLSQDRSRFVYKSNRSKNKLDDCVSSTKSKPENVQNREKNKVEYDVSENQGKNEHKVSENRHDRSSSRDRGKHESSQSRGNISDHSHSQEKNKHSSSQDESNDEYSSSGKRHQHFSKRTFGASKFNSSQHKHDITLNHEKSLQEQKVVKESNSFQNIKIQFSKNSEKVKEEMVERINTKTQSKFIEQNRLKYGDNKEKEERNRPLQKHSRVNSSSNKSRYSRSRSSSSESYSSSYSSSSSHSSRPKIRSVPSVIKTVSVKKVDSEIRNTFNENKSVGRNISSAIPQSSIHTASTKRNTDVIDYNKLPNIKSGQVDGDLKASDNKRVPVHMRLGAFPRKRVIQMPKDVEAAFVNSSSSSDSENVNTKCKRQNIRIVTDVYNAKSGMNLIHQELSGGTSAKRLPDIFHDKSKRVKTHR